MNKLTKLFFILCLTFLTVACGSNSTPNSSVNSSEQITLRYAFFAPEKTYPAVVAKKWGESLEQKTNGKVKVEFYFGGSLLDAGNMFDGVLNGVTDIGLTVLTYEPGRFPLVEISDMPSGFPNTKVASQVVSDLIHEFSPKELQDYKILKVFTTEPVYIQSKNPIASMQDIKGQQLRIGGALTPILTELGAAPVAMSQAEQAQALQTGIITGYASERAMLKDMGFAEIVKYYTDYPLGVYTLTALMNKSVWESLPTDVQEVIDQLSQEMPAIAGAYSDQYIKEAVEWSEKEHGLQAVRLSEDERKKWAEKMSSLQETAVKKAEEKGQPGTEYRKRLYELLEKYSKQ